MDLPQNKKTPRIQSLQLVDQTGFADLVPLLERTCRGQNELVPAPSGGVGRESPRGMKPRRINPIFVQSLACRASYGGLRFFDRVRAAKNWI